MPEIEEVNVRSLSREDPLEEGMATHTSVLAWKIPWTEEPGGLQSVGLQESNVTDITEPWLRTKGGKKWVKSTEGKTLNK